VLTPGAASSVRPRVELVRRSAGCSTWHRLVSGGPGAPRLTALEHAFEGGGHAGLIAGGMSGGRGPTLAARSAVGTAAEVGADRELAALQDRPRPSDATPEGSGTAGSPACRTALVPGPGDGRVAPGHRRRRPAGPRGVRRRRRCGYGHRRGVGARPPPAAGQLAGRSRSGVCGDAPRGCGAGGEFVTRAQSSAKRSRLLCPLGVALALLGAAAPAGPRSGVGAFARLVGVGCPLRSWRALLGAGQPEGLGPARRPPQCRAQAVSARPWGAVAVLALQWPRIVRAALVTVSAACRTWVRSPPAQPAT